MVFESVRQGTFIAKQDLRRVSDITRFVACAASAAEGMEWVQEKKVKERRNAFAVRMK
jgi:hypothetical protein